MSTSGRAPQRLFMWILLGGILIRVVTFVAMFPSNPDNHLQIIAHLMNFGSLPLSDEYGHSFHPPLYYLLALPFGLTRSAKFVQFFSLLLSVANLFLLSRLVRQSGLIRDVHARLHALALAALLPQFVRFSGFASNDGLSFTVGSLVLLSALAYNAAPSTRRLCLMGLALGTGLLTKGTHLAFAPVLAGLVLVVGLRERRSWQGILGALALFAAISSLVGGYKFAENTIHFGRPIVHNLDFRPPWMLAQLGTYQGLRSLFDFDLVALLEHPFVGPHTTSKIPLLLYGTFWYSYSFFESNLDAAWELRLFAIPRLVYLAGLLPTFLMATGLIVLLRRSVEWPGRLRDTSREGIEETGGQLCLASLLASLGLVMAAGLKYDAWSCFQSRLLFHVFFAISLVYALGLEAAFRRLPAARRPLNILLAASYLVLVLGMGFEVVVALSGWGFG